MKATLFAFFIALAIFLTPETVRCASPGTKIVTRIDTVTAVMKGGTLTVRVDGMASTPDLFGKGGTLLKRGQVPNKDGLLEYELVFNPPQKNYTGDKLKPIKAILKVSSVPAGVKGVRIYAEYNELDGMLPEPKQEAVSKKKKKEPFLQTEAPVIAKKEKPAVKKEELALKKEEPAKTSQWWNPFHHKPAPAQVNAPPAAAKKPEVAVKKKAPVVKKEEPIVAKKEKPALKQEEPKKPEVVLKKEEKPKHGWNWNPFHHKPVAEQVNAPPPPAPKKEAPVLKKKEPVVKKEELVVTKKEKPVANNEEVAPKIEKKKSRSWNLNPFHRKPAALQTEAMPPEPKKPELALKKKQPVVRTEESFATKKENPIPKKEEAAILKKEEAAPKKEKKSRGWNLNPFHRKPAGSQMDATPPEPKKEESAPKKKELVVTKEKPALKKEEAAPSKKEETEKKKKDHWYWNPFHRKSDASQNSDESPR